MEWYKEWFDTSLYEKMYAHRDETDAKKLANLIQKHFPKGDYPEVIDLACGRGRHSFNFASAGYSVTGFDLSENAIEKAKGKITDDLKGKVSFHSHDMRNPINKKCDLLINLFTSFGYFEQDDENEKVISEMANSTKENGAIVIDFLNPGYVQQNLKSFEETETDGLKVTIKRFIKEGMVCKDLTFSDEDHTRSKTFSERVKLYPKAWFRKAFEKNGFVISDAFGNYSGSPYNETESPRLVLFARRA